MPGSSWEGADARGAVRLSRQLHGRDECEACSSWMGGDLEPNVSKWQPAHIVAKITRY